MPILNPRKTVCPSEIPCGGTATITIRFDASASLVSDPADIVLILDRSCSMAPPRLDYAKAAAKQFIQVIAAASGTTDGARFGSRTRMGLVSFSDEARQELRLTDHIASLYRAVDALDFGGSTNHEAAFLCAEQLLPLRSQVRQIIVLFTDGVSTRGGDAGPVAARLKAAGVEIFCIGLGQDRSQLDCWASAPASSHVAMNADPACLEQLFLQVGSEIVLPGACDPVLQEQVSPEFQILSCSPPSHGAARITGPRTLVWRPGTVGLTPQPVPVSLSFEVRHIGPAAGCLQVNESLQYTDRRGTCLQFPSPSVQVTCGGGGGQVYPEPCPIPTEFRIEGCQDAQQVRLENAQLLSLGRIAQLDLTIRNVCPGKRLAVSVILTEIGECGIREPRGSKHILIPAQPGTQCRDLTLRCISFSLPEALDLAGNTSAICNPRRFAAQVIANYVDTDFVCCEAVDGRC